MASKVTYIDSSGKEVSQKEFSANLRARSSPSSSQEKKFFSKEGFYSASIKQTERGTEQETKFHGSTRPEGNLRDVHEGAKRAPTLTRGTRTYYEGPSPTIEDIRPQPPGARKQATVTQDTSRAVSVATSPLTPISTSQSIIRDLYPQQQRAPTQRGMFGGGEIQPDKSNLFTKAQTTLSNLNLRASSFIKQFKSTDPVTGEKDFVIGGTNWILPELEASRQRESEIRTKLETASGFKKFGLNLQLASEKTSQFIYGGEFGARERVREKPVSVAADFGLAYGISTGIAGLKFAGAKATTIFPKLKAAAPYVANVGLNLKRTGLGVYGLSTGTKTLFAPDAFERGKVIGEETVRLSSFVSGARASQSVTNWISRQTSLMKLRASLRADVDKSWQYDSSRVFYEPTGQKVFSVRGGKASMFQETRAVPRGELVFDTTGQPSIYGGKMLRQMTLKPGGKSIMSDWLRPGLSTQRINPSVQLKLSSKFRSGVLYSESGQVFYKQPTKPTLRIIRPQVQETLGQSYLRAEYGFKIIGKKGSQISMFDTLERGATTVWDVGSSLRPSLTKFTRTTGTAFSTTAKALTQGQYSGSIASTLGLASALRTRSATALRLDTLPSLRLAELETSQLYDTLKLSQRAFLKRAQAYSFLRQRYAQDSIFKLTTTQVPVLDSPLKDPLNDKTFFPTKPSRSRSFSPPPALFKPSKKSKDSFGLSVGVSRNMFNPKYFASVEASVLNVRAKLPKTRFASTGLNIRPIKL